MISRLLRRGGLERLPVLTQICGSARTELVSGRLPEPGGVAVARDGTVFATDRALTGGRLLQIRG
jgi:hypothetical protein